MLSSSHARSSLPKVVTPFTSVPLIMASQFALAGLPRIGGPSVVHLRCTMRCRQPCARVPLSSRCLPSNVLPHRANRLLHSFAVGGHATHPAHEHQPSPDLTSPHHPTSAPRHSPSKPSLSRATSPIRRFRHMRLQQTRFSHYWSRRISDASMRCARVVAAGDRGRQAPRAAGR